MTRRETGAQRRGTKRKKHSNKISLGLLAGLTACMLILAYAVSNGQAASPSSSVVQQSTTTIAAPPAQSISVLIPPTVGPYDEEGIPLLVNPDNMLPEGYEPPLGDIGGGYTLHTMAVEPFKAMQAAAREDGINLFPVSGYRTHEHQTRNYQNSIQRYINQGYSEEESIELTRRYYAIPGASEHEAGLAVDVNSLETSFEQTKEFEWLQQNCVRFGFIMRYAEDTTDITQIYYEPWHYRYVGTNHAQLIAELDVTLEEYVQMLEEQMG